MSCSLQAIAPRCFNHGCPANASGLRKALTREGRLSVQSTNGTDRAKQAGIEAAKAQGIYKGRKLSIPVTVSVVVPVAFRPPGVRRKPTREPACRLRRAR